MPRKYPALFAATLFLVLSCVLTSNTAVASDAAPQYPVIPGFERFYAKSAADSPDGGRLLLGELNCIACHKTEEVAKLSIGPRQAPVLDGVGERVRLEYLRSFIAAPHLVKPGTTMPDLLSTLPAAEKERRVEALVHFLASTGATREMAVTEQPAARGEELFHRVGCAACHQPKGDLPSLATSVPLGDLKLKYTLPSLTEFLRDPLHARPSGRMPSLNLNEEEARDIASFLLRGLEVPGNVRFAYFEGGWDKLPDFDILQPQATGTSPGIDVGLGRRRDQFGVRLEAFLQIDREGDYRFFLGSDDGSRLLIDGKVIVDNDDIHGTTWEEGNVKLPIGPHVLRVDYFEQGGEEVLKVEFEGPGFSRRPVDYALTLTPDGHKDGQPEFRVDPSLAAEGRKLFMTIGCAACHAMKVDGVTIASELQPPTLAKLAPDRGCLSEAPPSGVPIFGLSSQQKSALRTAVQAAGKNAIEPLPDKAAVKQILTAFNCYACHERDQIGGVEQERNTFFQTAIPEMGDEGRIPPHLTGVGDKLKPEWLQQVFNNGAKDRPYMHARMPKFGADNLGDLIGMFKTVDDQPDLALPEIDLPPRRLKSIGHRLVGDQGLSCIKCHTFGDLKSTGVQAMSLTTMHRRLNEDWYHRYMLNPPAFRPGTRMPAPWPGGVSLLPAILDGDALKQIHATWSYLADGDNAAVPRGLLQGTMELVATDRAILYRNFIEGAGPRAIGVGYPEKANLAFDANGMRLALLWHGAFIDASRHWVGRGAGFQPPLGRNVLKLPDGPPLAKLDSPDAPWPTSPAKEQGYRFHGYRLDSKERPTFLYEYAGVQTEDFPEAVETEDEPILRRTITIHPAGAENLWLRAAAGSSIERDGQWLVIDNDWRTRLVTENAAPLIRESNGHKEVLLQVPTSRGAVTVVQEYVW